MNELATCWVRFNEWGCRATVHDDGGATESCPTDEVCLSEEEAFSALIKAPDGVGEVHVDTMTASRRFQTCRTTPGSTRCGQNWWTSTRGA